MKVEDVMELGKINDNVYYLPHEVTTDRPVLGYIKGQYLSVMVDGGNSPKHVEKFYAELHEFGFSLPDYTILTHWHWDHAFGVCALKNTVIAHKRTNEKLEELMAWEWSNQEMQRRLHEGTEIELADTTIRLEYPDVSQIQVQKAQLAFDGKICLYLGGIHCEIERIPSPHSDDCVSVYVPQEKVVFLSDATSGNFYDENRYSKKETRALIQYIESLDVDICVLGHAEPITKKGVLIYLRGIYETLE